MNRFLIDGIQRDWLTKILPLRFTSNVKLPSVPEEGFVLQVAQQIQKSLHLQIGKLSVP